MSRQVPILFLDIDGTVREGKDDALGRFVNGPEDVRGESYPPHLGLFVGDRPEDEACAEALNVDFMWAKDWRELAGSPSFMQWWVNPEGASA